MRLPSKLLRAKFLSRPNRFAAWAELDGQAVYCYMPNPGRMHELLHPGAEMWLRHSPADGRHTSHEVVLVRHPQSLVCLDTRLPPCLFLEALEAGLLPELGVCLEVRREVTFGRSRLDLALACDTGHWLIETKSCTLTIDGVARFPDAPTLRGARHMEELIEAGRQGQTPVVAFVIQRPDATVFAPKADTDPVFADALRRAAGEGVQVFALTCKVTRRAVSPVKRIEVDLDR